MDKTIEELTLLLLYLTSWKEEGYVYNGNDELDKVMFNKSWKGYSFDALNSLIEKGYLYTANYKTKSVILTKNGIELVKTLKEKYNIKDND